MVSPNINIHPWLGLAPYREIDAAIFYGRSAEIRQLTDAISNFPQTIVFGPSGTGKTSILQAGVFPKLEALNFLPVYVRFDHSEKAADYGDQLLFLFKEKLQANDIEVLPVSQAVFPDGPESLWEFLHRYECWSPQNQLIKPVFVIDQFEEIFTVTSKKERIAAFITELGDLCTGTVPDSVKKRLEQSRTRLGYSIETQNYRIVISLREDFLARLEELTVSIPILRRNRYSLQALTGKAAMEVVLEPGKGLVDENVARTIIYKAAVTDHDKGDPGLENIKVEPALLSLLCSELNNRRIELGMDHISAGLVEASGSDIIKHFYEEAMSIVSPETAAYIEDNLLTASGYRNSVALDDMLSHGIVEKQIIDLVERRLLRFEELMGVKRVEFAHDILTIIARSKRENRRYERKLETDRKTFQLFEAERKRQRKKLKRSILTSIVLFILLLGVCLTGYLLFFHRYEYKYAYVIKRWGSFEGINRLSDEQASHRAQYYKLEKKGWYTFSLKKKHFDKMYSMDGYGHLNPDHDMATYLNSTSSSDTGVDMAIREKLSSVCQWSMIYDENGRVVYEIGLDKDTAMVWGFDYSPSMAASAAPSQVKKDTSLPQNNALYKAAADNTVMGHFVDNTGLLMKVRAYGADFIQISYDRNGYDSLLRYFDEFGHPAEGPFGAYASQTIYNDKGLVTSMASLDMFGDYMIDWSGNTGMDISYDNNNNMAQVASFGVHHEKKSLNSGYTIARYSYDSYGNFSGAAYYDSTGKKPVIINAGIQSYQRFYNENGSDTLTLKFDVAGRLVKYSPDRPGVIPVSTAQYDNNGNLTGLAYYEVKNGVRLPVHNSTGEYHKFTARYNSAGRQTEKFWYDANMKLIKSGYSGMRVWCDANGRDTLKIYYNEDSMPSPDYYIVKKKYTDDYLGCYNLFNEKGKPTDSSGIHCVTTTRDKKRFIDTIAYLDLSGHPVRTMSYAFIVKVYRDEKFDKAILESYLDADGRYVNVDDEGAKIRRRYDNNGNPIDIWHYGVSQARQKDLEQVGTGFYQHMKACYDIHHHIIGLRTYKDNDEPANHNSNYFHRVTKRFRVELDTMYGAYTENDEKINAQNTLSEAIYIAAVLSDTSQANRLGARENDIIMSWGHWQYDARMSGEDNKKLLGGEIARTRNQDKDIVLLRLSDKKNPVKRIRLSAGPVGIRYATKFLTEKENIEVRKLLDHRQQLD